jgi:hypothetical protein
MNTVFDQGCALESCRAAVQAQTLLDSDQGRLE